MNTFNDLYIFGPPCQIESSVFFWASFWPSLWMNAEQMIGMENGRRRSKSYFCKKANWLLTRATYGSGKTDDYRAAAQKSISLKTFLCLEILLDLLFSFPLNRPRQIVGLKWPFKKSWNLRRKIRNPADYFQLMFRKLRSWALPRKSLERAPLITGGLSKGILYGVRLTTGLIVFDLVYVPIYDLSRRNGSEPRWKEGPDRKGSNHADAKKWERFQ